MELLKTYFSRTEVEALMQQLILGELIKTWISWLRAPSFSSTSIAIRRMAEANRSQNDRLAPSSQLRSDALSTGWLQSSDVTTTEAMAGMSISPVPGFDFRRSSFEYRFV